MYEEKFEIFISGNTLSPPYFEDFEPKSNYDLSEDGPLDLPAWLLTRKSENYYHLPSILDKNNFEVIEAFVRFGDETSNFIKACNCIELDQEDMTLVMILDPSYEEA